MENHHFPWVNPLWITIFNSYVKLPEGSSPNPGFGHDVRSLCIHLPERMRSSGDNDDYDEEILNQILRTIFRHTHLIIFKFAFVDDIYCTVYGNYIQIYDFLSIRTGILDYPRECFPWPGHLNIRNPIYLNIPSGYLTVRHGKSTHF